MAKIAEVPDYFGSIPNIRTFFPKSFRYLPVISTIPCSAENHGVSTFEAERIQKTYLNSHQSRHAERGAGGEAGGGRGAIQEAKSAQNVCNTR